MRIDKNVIYASIKILKHKIKIGLSPNEILRQTKYYINSNGVKNINNRKKNAW